METTKKQVVLQQAWQQGEGILRLLPAWVPRAFCRPGRRLRLHPDDYYALGLTRGGIDERWLASTTNADNGPGTPEDEGLSYIAGPDGHRVLLTEAVAELKGDLIGDKVYEQYGVWPVLAKFFDNLGPLPFHVHHNDETAARIGARGKPESYFFPAQMNPHPGEFPYTFFGLLPGTTREQLLDALKRFEEGDNRVTDLSHAVPLTPDTGWDIPAGILHAPGSLCTYEPQFASDVLSMFQSVLPGGHTVDVDLLWKGLPPEQRGDHEALLGLLDWETNADPDFTAHRQMPPVAARSAEETEETGFLEEWIGYRSPLVSAKRLTLQPGRTVLWKEPVAYGVIAIQGHGQFGPHRVETPLCIRFGQETGDEFFAGAEAMKNGIRITNESRFEPLVLLCHTSAHPDRPGTR